VPIFQDQLEKGQPLTITDPEMTRYFMTIPEASWLILDAAAIAQSGGLFVLDMGEPVKIIDIARDLVRLSGRDPESVPIKVIGTRKGEKLHEELFYDQESVEPTEVPKVLRAESQAPPEHVREDVRGFLSMTTSLPSEELARALHAYVRASVETGEGLWGVVETGGLTSEEIGTRPVVIVPVHGNGQGAGNGQRPTRGVRVGAGRHVASVAIQPGDDVTPLAYLGDPGESDQVRPWSGSKAS
jgi:hypothetical protein